MSEYIAPRTAIRQSVRDLLRVALPTWDARITPERIHVSRAIALSPQKLPAVLIYTRDERIEQENYGIPNLRQHTLDVAVEVVAGGDDASPDTSVDFLAAAVESIMDANETLGNLVESAHHTRTDVDIDGDGEYVFVAARLTFSVKYYTKTLFLSEIATQDGKIIHGGLPHFTPDDGSTGDPPAQVIIGMTQGLGTEAVTARPKTILYSTAPIIGPPHEDAYVPLTQP